MERREERLAKINIHARSLLKWWDWSREEQKERGRRWYTDASRECRELASKYNRDYALVVCAAAALSPNKSWKHSVKALEKMLSGGSGVHFGRQEKAARACLDGDMSALSGPKVTQFARAIVGHTDACVIDVHMRRAMGSDKKHSPDPGRPYNDLAQALTLAAHLVSVPVTTFQATVWITVKDENKRERKSLGLCALYA